MIFPAFLAQATPAPTALIPDDQLLHRGLEITNLALIYVGSAIAIYVVLLIAGRIAKKRLGIPLGWIYHLFAFSMALFVPALLPFVNFPSVEPHIDAATVLTATFVIISILRHYMLGPSGDQPDGTAKVPKFLSQIISIIIVLAALAGILQGIYHQEVPGLLAGAGIVGIVLGLALQDTLGNIFSGFAIYFGGQFKPGDWLKIADDHAEIIEMNWRSTRLRTEDNIYLDIPNSNITKETLVNFTHPTTLHAMRLEIGLDYEAPPTKVQHVLTEATLTAQHVLKEPAPEVYLKNFADSSVTYEIKFWMTDHRLYCEVMSAVRINLWYALRRNNISIPFPMQVEVPYAEPHEKYDRSTLIRTALSKVFFSECLNEDHLTHLVEHARPVQFGKREHLISQGHTGTSMYVIMEGSAEVLVEINGEPRSVAKLKAGDCFGEMSLLTGENRSATIVALEDTLTVKIDKETLAPIIENSPDLLDGLSELLTCRRLQNEGLLAQSVDASLLSEKQNTYRSNFLAKLKSIFSI